MIPGRDGATTMAVTTATQQPPRSVVPDRLLTPPRRPPASPPDDAATDLFRAVPPPRRPLVRRERLLHLLDAAVRRQLTLIVAPSGYGKTTLVAQWAALSRGRRIGWLGLKGTEDDPDRFEQLLERALAPVVGGSGDAPTRRSRGDLPVVVVLDDLHAISYGLVSDPLVAALDAMPWLRFVLIAPSDPLVPGPRLRLSQPVVEIRRRDLAFDRWEARELLTKVSRKTLTDEHVEAILGRTNGCAASLQLAAVSLRSIDDVDGFVERFAGDDRHAADVLTERVLHEQPDDLRRFLLRTSVLDEMNASLCDFVAGTTNGQAMLDRLDRAALPLMPLDHRRAWFRLHRLPRVFLRQHLRAEDAGAEAELLERAASWHLAHDDVAQALGYLARAESWDTLADVVLREGPRLLAKGRSGVVTQWVGLLPARVLAQRPSLSLLEAADRLSGTPTPAVGTLLRRIDERVGLSDADRVALVGLRAQWQLENGELPAAIASAEAFLAAEATLEPADGNGGDLLALDGMRALLAATVHLVRATALTELGDLARAREALAPAFDRAVPLTDVHGLGIAAIIAARGGRLRLASRTATRALDLADAHGLSRHRTLAAPLLALAQVARERDEPGDADHLLHLAERAAGPSSFVAKLIDVERAEHELAAGRYDEAQAIITLNRDDWAVECPAVAVRVRGIEAQLAFVFGGPGQASASLDRPSGPEGLEVAKERVRLAVAEGDIAGARAILDRWPEQPAPRARQLHALWDVALASATDGPPADVRPLSRLVIELEQEGNVGLLLDVGAPLVAPLRLLHRTAPSPFLRRALEHPRLASSSAARPVKPLAETLTAQEMTVLGYLPSWISNAGIAERLGVSLNTIKTHMKHIYRKLDVADRREAVEVARSLGLL